MALVLLLVVPGSLSLNYQSSDSLLIALEVFYVKFYLKCLEH